MFFVLQYWSKCVQRYSPDLCIKTAKKRHPASPPPGCLSIQSHAKIFAASALAVSVSLGALILPSVIMYVMAAARAVTVPVKAARMHRTS